MHKIFHCVLSQLMETIYRVQQRGGGAEAERAVVTSLGVVVP